MSLPSLQENATWYGIYPINPLSRWIQTGTLYLESGVQSFCTGYLNPDCYKPSIWYYDPTYTEFLGYLRVDERDGGSTVAIDASAVLKTGKKRESKSLGCSVKYKEVVMFNPTLGLQGLVARSYQTEDVFFNIDVAGPSGLVPVLTPNKQSHVVDVDSLDPSGYGIGDDTEKLAFSDTPVFCEADIITRKWVQAQIPPSTFSGKLRLFVQVMYGSLNFPYSMDEGKLLITSSDPNVELVNTPHYTVLLYTDSQYRYYLFRILNNKVYINKLHLSADGELLRRYIVQTNPTGDTLRELESYVLSTARPTIWMVIPSGEVALSNVVDKGSSYYWGWNANWKGDKWVLCTRRRQADPQVYIASMHQLTISESGLDALHDTWNSCKACWEEFGTSPTQSEIDSSSDCQSCDITPPTEDTEDGFYGLPYSEDFLNKMVDCFSISYGELESEEKYQFPFGQQVKIWYWDKFYAMYMWEVPYTIPTPPVEDVTNYDVPIYCYFGSDEVLKVLRLRRVEQEEEENFGTPYEKTCRSSNGYECGVSRTSSSFFGFYTQDVDLSTFQNGSFNASYDDFNVTEYEEDPIFTRSGSLHPCGTPCEGAHAPLSGPKSCWSPDVSSTAWWLKKTVGKGTGKSIGIVGTEITSTAAVFIKSNCESVGLVVQSVTGGNASVSTYDLEGCLRSKTTPFCYWNCMEQQYVGPSYGKNLVNYDTCADLRDENEATDPNRWIIWGPSFTLTSGFYWSDDCVARPNEFCGELEGIVYEAKYDPLVNLGVSNTVTENKYLVDWHLEAHIMNKEGTWMLESRTNNNGLNVVSGCQSNAFDEGNDAELAKDQEEVKGFRRFVDVYPVLFPYTEAGWVAYQMTSGPLETVVNDKRYSNLQTWPWEPAHYYYCGSV